MHILLFIVVLFSISTYNIGQTINLGTATNFVLFSTDGAVTNTGISQLTGKVGTNNGSSTGFGNVNGGMHDGGIVSAQAAADLLIAYNQINALIPAYFPAPLLGNGQILTAGVYSISGASTLSLDLILDAQNNPNAVFVIQINGSFSTNANSSVNLINGAQACNVFWKIEGLLDMAANTTMRGTLIVNNAGIVMGSANTLEGRVLTTTGAVTVNSILAYTPVGCGSPILTGPLAPSLGEAACYGIFSIDGPVQNSGITNIVGDVGSNVGLTTGFDSLLITGSIHPIPDASTADAAINLLSAYSYLNGLVPDIELLYPAQFGGNLVLTPHTYVLNGATSLTDTLYLNAQGEANAVFIIKIYGALQTSVNSNVVLMNGAQAKNVYWLINGAVNIFANSIFRGSIISQGSIVISSGVVLNGRALSGVGSISLTSITGTADIIPGNCNLGVNVFDNNSKPTVSVYPNPFSNSTTINLNNTDEFNNIEFHLYNVLGVKVMAERITSNSTTFNTSNLPSGVYFYKVIGDNQIISSGKLISKKD